MKTLKILLLTIILLGSFTMANAQAIACSVSCPLGDCTGTGTSAYCHCGSSGEPVCGSNGKMMTCNVTQAENILACKNLCEEYNTFHGLRASIKYQQIYSLLHAHNFSIDNSSADFQTIQNYILELNSIISVNFTEDEKNSLTTFISGLTY